MNDAGDRKAALEEAVRKLDAGGVAHPRRNAEWMLCDVLDCSRADLYAHPEALLSEPARERLRDMVERRLRHEPLQYILGYTDFYRLRLRVTPAVLIPRPETEQVVEHALELIAAVARPRVFDVGTGSGCIALAIKRERPDAEVWACDVSDEALSVAQENAGTHGLDVSFFQADAFSDEFVRRAPGELHLLISNPPYVPEEERASMLPEVRDHEPPAALFSGDDALVFYRRLAAMAPGLLRKGGWVVLETHAETGIDAVGVLLRKGLSDVRLDRDYAGQTRILSARWKPGAR